MATIKGQNLRILIGATTASLKCVAAASSCTIHLQTNLGDTSDKDTEKAWIQQEPISLAWDVTVEAMVTDTTATSAIRPQDLTIGQKYVLRFSQTAETANTQNRSPLTNVLQLTGTAILTDFQYTGTNRQPGTWSAKFIGDSDLTQYHT